MNKSVKINIIINRLELKKNDKLKINIFFVTDFKLKSDINNTIEKKTIKNKKCCEYLTHFVSEKNQNHIYGTLIDNTRG